MLARNEAELMVLERRVADLVSAGDDELAATWCQVAGEFAWLAHTGHMARPALDRAIETMGLRGCPRGDRGAPPAGPERVLHVMTEVAATGGHSRLAWRGIARDVTRVPTLALTGQTRPVPAQMEAAVAARGGRIERQAGPDLIARGRELAALVDRHDMVVLHVHPSDVVSGLALADRRGRPPVLLVNHADHCFWLGPGVPDMVVSTRRAASRLSTRRRGVAGDRVAELAVPTDLAGRGRSRSRARAILGVPDDAVLMVVVAADYKTRAVDGTGLLDVLIPAVDAIPGAIVLAAGPADAGPWEEARRRTGGRIRALGTVEDTGILRDAADIHLDSFPCSSQTSALEAAAAGVPIVSYQPPRPGAATYDLDDRALRSLHVRATTPAGFRDTLARLADDPATRERVGLQTMQAVHAEHDPARWCGRLEDVYRRTRVAAACGHGDTPPIERGPDDAREDAFLAALHRATGLVGGVRDAIGRAHDAFPADPAKGLSIVIYARDDAGQIMPLLRSAMATTEHLAAVEAIVVDDASTDGTRDLLRGLDGDIRTIRNARRRGPHASFVAAAEIATGPAVLLVTADIRLEPGWCQALSRALAEPGVSATSPSVHRDGDPSAEPVSSAHIDSPTGVCLLASGPAMRAGIALVRVDAPDARVASVRAPRATAHAPA